MVGQRQFGGSQPLDPKRDQANFSPRKPAQREYIPREVRDSIVRRVCIHGDRLRSVAQPVGMTDNEVVQVLIEEWVREWNAAHSRGFAEGKLYATFPMRPVGSAARAA